MHKCPDCGEECECPKGDINEDACSHFRDEPTCHQPEYTGEDQD